MTILFVKTENKEYKVHGVNLSVFWSKLDMRFILLNKRN